MYMNKPALYHLFNLVYFHHARGNLYTYTSLTWKLIMIICYWLGMQLHMCRPTLVALLCLDG